MSYTVLVILSCIFPAWILIGIIFGIYQVVSKLPYYFSGGFQYGQMFFTVILYAFIWPITLFPTQEMVEREKWMNETEINEMTPRWLLLRMSEGESAYTLAKRYGKPVNVMRSYIHSQATCLPTVRDKFPTRVNTGKRATIIE